MQTWLRRKDIDQVTVHEEGRRLVPTLSWPHLVALGIGAIVGTGIYTLIGVGANLAGPAVLLSFLVAGVVCACAALAYAEMATMMPAAGSAYTYGYATLGEFIAWIIGWDLILEYLFGAATVAVGWSGYFTAFMNELGLHIPYQYAQAPLRVVGTHDLVRSMLCISPATNQIVSDTLATCAPGLTAVQGVINVPAILLTLCMTALLVVGIKESANFNNIIVLVKVAIVLLVIAFGFAYVNKANWHPFIPANTGHFGDFGWSGVARAAGVT